MDTATTAASPAPTQPPTRDVHGRVITSLPEEVVLTPMRWRQPHYCARCARKCWTDPEVVRDGVEVYCSAACYQAGPTAGEPYDVVAVAEKGFELFHVTTGEVLEHLLVDVSAPGAGATIDARGTDMVIQHIGFHGLNEQPATHD